MLIALCFMAAIIMTLACIVVRIAYQNSELKEKVSKMINRPDIDGLSEHSTRLIIGYIQARRIRDGTIHEAAKREREKPYRGEWE